MATARFCLIGPIGSKNATMFRTMLITLSTAFALVAPLLPVQAQTSPETVAKIQAAIQRFPEQVRSMSCQFTATTTIGDAFTQENDVPEGAIPPLQVEQGEWAFKDNKVINSSHFIKGDPAPPGHDTATAYLFDGSGSYNIRAENGGLAERSTYGTRQQQTKAVGYSGPLPYGYQLNGQWLSDALNSSKPIVERVGVDSTLGQLYVIHLNLRGREERIWFAPKYNDVAVRIVEEDANKRLVSTGAYYQLIGHLWMPLEGNVELLTKQPNGQLVFQFKRKTVFSNIQVNKVSDEAFNFHWPIGAALYDSDTRTKYFRDASGNWVKRTAIAEEIAHTPSRVSAADLAPWVLLVCLTTLLTLGVLRWRRRASA